MIYRLTPQTALCSGLVLVSLVLATSCSHAAGPRKLSNSMYAATSKAVEALEAANQERDANSSVFEPKMQVASQAADELFNEMGSQSDDGYAVSQVKSCVEQLKQYRLNFDSRDSVSRPIQDQLKGLKGAQIKDSSDVVARSSRELDACITTAKSYL